MWRELGVRNSYTMEATFCGSLLGKQSGHHFNTADLETMGRHLCDTLLEYCDPDRTKVGVSRGRVHLVILSIGYLCVYSMSVCCLAWMCVHFNSYACGKVCACMHVGVAVCVCMCVGMSVCVCVCMQVGVSVCVYMCVYVCVSVCVCVCMCMGVNVCVYACRCECMCMCVYACV